MPKAGQGLTFSAAAPKLKLSAGNSVVEAAEEGGGGAVCTAADTIMSTGRHYAEFELVRGHHGIVGVAQADFDPAAGVLPTTTPVGWGISCEQGTIFHNTPEWCTGVSRTPGPTFDRNQGEWLDCPSGFLPRNQWKGFVQGDEGDVMGCEMPATQQPAHPSCHDSPAFYV